MTATVQGGGLGWFGILRLGLVQTCLGAIVVLTTSTLNRIMVVELVLPAVLPGLLVGIHHAVQISRPHFGHGSDLGGRFSHWILGGMSVMALGGVAAASGTALAATQLYSGIALCVLGFFAIGLGASAAGTTLLVTLAKHVAPQRKAAAASTVWIMMIAGFAITASVAGHFLDPYSPGRLVAVTMSVCVLAVLLTALALFRLEPPPVETLRGSSAAPGPGRFGSAVRQVWREAETRLFTLFVFISMLAYSFQDLILEPFAGVVFGMTPGQSTQLAGVQHGGVLLGMITVALSSSLLKGSGPSLRAWTVGGCLASAAALAGIATGGFASATWPLVGNVFLLGFANGAFAVGAIASMMTLAGDGAAHHEGLRMGLWGAAQAFGFALGGLIGTVAIDIARWLLSTPEVAYATVFTIEACLFVVAALMGARLRHLKGRARAMPAFGKVAMAEVMDGS